MPKKIFLVLDTKLSTFTVRAQMMGVRTTGVRSQLKLISFVRTSLKLRAFIRTEQQE